MKTSSYQFGVSEFTTWPWTFDQDVENYARLGVQAIEVCEFKMDPKRLEEQIQIPSVHGLEITSIQPAIRTLFPSKSMPEPLDPKARMGIFQKSIERLAASAPNVSFVTNTGIAPNGNIQQVVDTAAEQYQELADFAASHGARIALEPLNSTIMNIETSIWTLAQGMEIVRAVDRENFGICLDLWNIWQNADILAEIQKCGDKIFVVQLSDWRTPRAYDDRLIPGQGEIPMSNFLQAIREAGFRGAYSVEIFSRGVPNPLWEADLTEVIQQSKAGLDIAWQSSF